MAMSLAHAPTVTGVLVPFGRSAAAGRSPPSPPSPPDDGGGDLVAQAEGHLPVRVCDGELALFADGSTWEAGDGASGAQAAALRELEGMAGAIGLVVRPRRVVILGEPADDDGLIRQDFTQGGGDQKVPRKSVAFSLCLCEQRLGP